MDHFDHVHWAMQSGGVEPGMYDNGGELPKVIGSLYCRLAEPVLTPAAVEVIRRDAGEASRD